MSAPERTTVSVVIPVWNRSALVRRALDSVLAQTRPADEVLVVDDGSTDDTAAVVRRDFESVRLLTQENRGVSAARNHGIRAARSELVAFLDSDDQWAPGKLERQIEAMESSPDAVLRHTDEIWIRRGLRVNPMKKHRKHGGHIFEHALPLCAISPSATVVRRRLFDEVGLFDESLPACEDYDLWLRVTARFPVLYVDEPLTVKYGGHDDQLSRRYFGMDRFRILALEKILRSDALRPDHRLAAEETLRKKVRIYADGARRRGKWEEAALYEAKLPLRHA